MARGKREAEELSLKEKLQQVLVPVDEQPYPIPENWCWVTIGAIALVKGGKRVPKGKQFVGYKTKHPYIRVSDFDNHSIATEQVKYINEETFKLIHNYTISTHDIYISIAGTIGKVGIIPDDLDGANLTENAARITKIRGISQNFLLWLLESEVAQSQMRDSTISTTQPKLALFRIENVKIPLPPLVEQQRIVEQIESLFAKLHEISEKVKSVFEQYKKDRATLIHKAYIGELTKHWRKESGIDKSWEQIKIKELCKSLKYGTSKKSKERGTMIVVRMGNLQNGEIIWDNLAYTDDNEDIEKYMLEKGDVLFNRTNSSEWVGKTSIYRGEYPAIYAGYLIKLDYYRDKVIGDFLNYMLNSPKAKEYCNLVKTDGVNQSNINAKKIGEFVIPVPSLEEQKEIVRILDTMSIKQKRILELAEKVMEEIVLMKKSILSKAFRGELSTNNSEEESSIELLKKILVET